MVLVRSPQEFFVVECLEELVRRGGREGEEEVRRRCEERWGRATEDERR